MEPIHPLSAAHQRQSSTALDHALESYAHESACALSWENLSATATLVATRDGSPIRSIITGRRRVTTGSYASRKAGRGLPYESMSTSHRPGPGSGSSLPLDGLGGCLRCPADRRNGRRLNVRMTMTPSWLAIRMLLSGRSFSTRSTERPASPKAMRRSVVSSPPFGKRSLGTSQGRSRPVQRPYAAG